MTAAGAGTGAEELLGREHQRLAAPRALLGRLERTQGHARPEDLVCGDALAGRDDWHGMRRGGACRRRSHGIGACRGPRGAPRRGGRGGATGSGGNGEACPKELLDGDHLRGVLGSLVWASRSEICAEELVGSELDSCDPGSARSCGHARAT